MILLIASSRSSFMILSLLLLSFFISLSFPHTCIHNQLISEQKKQGITHTILKKDGLPMTEYSDYLSRPETRQSGRHNHLHRYTGPENFTEEQKTDQVVLDRLERKGEVPRHDPIRIYIAKEVLGHDPYTCYSTNQTVLVKNKGNTIEYQCTPEDVLTDAKFNYMVNSLLIPAVEYFQQALRVVRSQSPLFMSPSDTCIVDSFGVNVPSNITLSTVGVPYDFILLPTARPILGTTVLAFAGHCAVNSIGRPIWGHINFNCSDLVDSDGDYRRLLGLITHEITHALVFSPILFKYFIKYLGYDPIQNTWVYQRNGYVTNRAPMYPLSNYNVSYVITPAVKDAAKNHFNCDNIIGAQLEDSGGSGTEDSHWEKRLFMNEYMTGSDSNYPIISNMTLALLQDSGWYEVNFDLAQPLIWGNNLGCSFLADCGGWASIPSAPTGFCDTNTDSKEVFCNIDRTGYGYCNIKEYLTPLDVEYRHFGNPYTGGQNQLADYCAYVGQRGTTVFCNIGGSDVQQSVDSLDQIDTAQQFELNSRCYFSTISKLKTELGGELYTDVLIGGERTARCYNTSCVDPDDLRIQINNIWYPCIGKVKALGYGGYVECPNARDICKGVKRDITWPRFIRVNPKSGPPGTVITITGENFDSSKYTYRVMVEYECTDVQVLNRQTIIARVPSSDVFSDFFNLYFFQTQKSVLVRDSRGYTSHREKAFTLLVDLDIEYFKGTGKWMVKYPLWAFVIWICILTPCLITCLMCYKLLWRKRGRSRPLPPEANSREITNDEYRVTPRIQSPIRQGG